MYPPPPHYAPAAAEHLPAPLPSQDGSGYIIPPVQVKREVDRSESDLDSTVDTSAHHEPSEIQIQAEMNNSIDAPKKRKCNKRTQSVVDKLAAFGIDLQKTAFLCNETRGVRDGSKYADSERAAVFNETLPFLPEGWRLKKYKNGSSLQTVFLSPNLLQFTSNVCVVEYLHLEGKTRHEEVMNIAQAFKIKQSMLDKIFKNVTNEEQRIEAPNDVSVDTSRVDDTAQLGDTSMDVTAESSFDSASDFDSAADNLMKELDKDLETFKSYSMEENVENRTEEKTEESKDKSDVSARTSLAELLAAQGIDIKKSAYFSKTKQCITNGSQSAPHFKETLSFLPEGWKFRTLDVNDRGKVVVHKHYLSPANILLKSTMGVIEYLRLEGKLGYKELMEVAKSLKVGPVKLKKLFTDDDAEGGNESLSEEVAAV